MAQVETLCHTVGTEFQGLFAKGEGTKGLHTEEKMDLLAMREKRGQELLLGNLKIKE